MPVGGQLQPQAVLPPEDKQEAGWTAAWVRTFGEKGITFTCLLRTLDCSARNLVDLPSNYPAPTTVCNINQFYVLPTQCIYVFCVDLRTDSDYFPILH